jgi:FkbM family methyltransferase
MGLFYRQRSALKMGVSTSEIAGRHPLDRAYVFGAAAAMPLKARVAADHWLRVPARLPDGQRRQFVIGDFTDLLVLHDTLVEGQYAEPALDNPAVIVDAGSHIGASVAYFATQYRDARIVALEPAPRTFRRLQANIRCFPNVTAHQLAVGGEDGFVDFYERLDEGWASSTRATPKGEKVRVRMMDLDAIMEAMQIEHIDLLKLDIEGSEHDALRAFQPTPAKAGVIVGETHTGHPGVTFTDEEVAATLGAYHVEWDFSGRDRMFRATPHEPPG